MADTDGRRFHSFGSRFYLRGFSPMRSNRHVYANEIGNECGGGVRLPVFLYCRRESSVLGPVSRRRRSALVPWRRYRVRSPSDRYYSARFAPARTFAGYCPTSNGAC